MKQTTTIGVSMLSLALVLIVLTTPFVVISSQQYAEAQKTASQIASEFQSDKQCILTSCVQVEYDSPTIAVVSGDYLLFNSDIPDYVPNTIIWKVVESLKSQGFTIDSVTMGGEGSKGNPNMYHVVMSKQ